MGNLTPKQEKFWRKYMKCGCATEAYRSAYNCKKMKPETVHRCAKELLDNPKIATRIKEFSDKKAEELEVTVESLAAEYDNLIKLALKDKQYSPAVSALTKKGELFGTFKKHQKQGNKVIVPMLLPSDADL